MLGEQARTVLGILLMLPEGLVLHSGVVKNARKQNKYTSTVIICLTLLSCRKKQTNPDRLVLLQETSFFPHVRKGFLGQDLEELDLQKKMQLLRLPLYRALGHMGPIRCNTACLCCESKNMRKNWWHPKLHFLICFFFFFFTQATFTRGTHIKHIVGTTCSH